MKNLFAFLFLLPALVHAQVLIHSHNDYTHAKPFEEALANKVFSMEADIYPVNGQLMVAHTRNEIKTDRTLSALYIEPIIKQFVQHKNRVTADTGYTFSLLIDIKEDPVESMKLLVGLFNKYPKYFNRKKNPKAVRVIITGNQGDKANWKKYPSYIYFDGKPAEQYDAALLKRIAIFSDNYNNYFPFRGSPDSTKFQQTIRYVHSLGKPIRFWAAPDDETSWKALRAAGADIINTDQVSECRRVFSRRNGDGGGGK